MKDTETKREYVTSSRLYDFKNLIFKNSKTILCFYHPSVDDLNLKLWEQTIPGGNAGDLCSVSSQTPMQCDFDKYKRRTSID